jgi:hypothetical protein
MGKAAKITSPSFIKPFKWTELIQIQNEGQHPLLQDNMFQKVFSNIN